MSAAEIQEFRKAARLVIVAPKPRRARLQALMRLASRARGSEAGILAQQAVWVEAKAFIRNEPPPPPLEMHDPIDNALRGLTRRGLARCPTCHRRLPDEQTLDREQRRRTDELERRRLFEEAGR
jgi:hypothetical protein